MTGTTINTPIVIECYDRHPRESQKLNPLPLNRS